MDHNNRQRPQDPSDRTFAWARLPSIGLRGGLVDVDWNRSASGVGNFRERDVELAVDESSLGQARVTRTRAAYGPSKSTEVALDEMKRHFGSRSLDALF